MTVATPRGPAPRASGLQSSRTHFQAPSHADFRALSLPQGADPPMGTGDGGTSPSPDKSGTGTGTGTAGDRRGSAPCLALRRARPGAGLAGGACSTSKLKFSADRPAVAVPVAEHTSEAPSLRGRCQWLRSSESYRLGPRAGDHVGVCWRRCKFTAWFTAVPCRGWSVMPRTRPWSTLGRRPTRAVRGSIDAEGQ